MLDVYDLPHDINQALLTRGVKRFEETVRAAIFSGILSETIAASLARHSRVLNSLRLSSPAVVSARATIWLARGFDATRTCAPGTNTGLRTSPHSKKKSSSD